MSAATKISMVLAVELGFRVTSLTSYIHYITYQGIRVMGG